MSKGQHSFKQGDVTKAIRAVVKAGVPVRRVVIEGGKIIVVAGRPEDGEELNEWDSVK
jgi:hypothetical protein